MITFLVVHKIFHDVKKLLLQKQNKTSKQDEVACQVFVNMSNLYKEKHTFFAKMGLRVISLISSKLEQLGLV